MDGPFSKGFERNSPVEDIGFQKLPVQPKLSREEIMARLISRLDTRRDEIDREFKLRRGSIVSLRYDVVDALKLKTHLIQ